MTLTRAEVKEYCQNVVGILNNFSEFNQDDVDEELKEKIAIFRREPKK